MISYIIQRLDTGEYYKHRQYGNRWVSNPIHAKRYSRRSDAGNAIALMRGYKFTGMDRVNMLVHEYELRPTGKTYEYPAN